MIVNMSEYVHKFTQIPEHVDQALTEYFNDNNNTVYL